MMKTKDKSRKWMWTFLAALVLLQMYFVWELLAVFALFSQHPIMLATRQRIYAVEDVVRRPFRRPGSAPAR